ncbi:MAG: hypothetical protein ACLQVY_24485 [Limisphaerales bacterium]
MDFMLCISPSAIGRAASRNIQPMRFASWQRHIARGVALSPIARSSFQREAIGNISCLNLIVLCPPVRLMEADSSCKARQRDYFYGDERTGNHRADQIPSTSRTGGRSQIRSRTGWCLDSSRVQGSDGGCRARALRADGESIVRNAAATVAMKYRFRATEKFWTSFYRLTPQQKESCRKAWLIFKDNPFDIRLRAHKIHGLSARYGRTIFAVVIEADLRLLFYLEDQTITSLIVGTHSLYQE